jgi:hypothetical protein
MVPCCTIRSITACMAAAVSTGVARTPNTDFSDAVPARVCSPEAASNQPSASSPGCRSNIARMTPSNVALLPILCAAWRSEAHRVPTRTARARPPTSGPPSPSSRTLRVVQPVVEARCAARKLSGAFQAGPPCRATRPPRLPPSRTPPGSVAFRGSRRRTPGQRRPARTLATARPPPPAPGRLPGPGRHQDEVPSRYRGTGALTRPTCRPTP